MAVGEGRWSDTSLNVARGGGGDCYAQEQQRCIRHSLSHKHTFASAVLENNSLGPAFSTWLPCFFCFFLVEDLPQWSSSGLHDLTRTKRCNRYRPRGRTLAVIAEVCFSDTFGIRSPHLRDNWISKHLASHIWRLHCNWFHWVLFAFPITSVASGPF